MLQTPSNEPVLYINDNMIGLITIAGRVSQYMRGRKNMRKKNKVIWANTTTQLWQDNSRYSDLVLCNTITMHVLVLHVIGMPASLGF